MGVKAHHLHSEIDTIERTEILNALRIGHIDVVVGINLLREGLDIPEVSLVAIFDADRQGFLRNERSLLQTIGRAARNENGRVLLYANGMSPAMEASIRQTLERRVRQNAHNEKHGIIPKTIIKALPQMGSESGDLIAGTSTTPSISIDFTFDMVPTNLASAPITAFDLSICFSPCFRRGLAISHPHQPAISAPKLTR